MLDEFTDDFPIIYEFIYYLSLYNIRSIKWIHLLSEFNMNSSIIVLDEFIWFASLDEITEFIGYMNSYIKWNQLLCTIFDQSSEFTCYLNSCDFPDEFTFDSKIIHEFIYYGVRWILMIRVIRWNHWIHWLHESIH
jgi:hypothetical protein